MNPLQNLPLAPHPNLIILALYSPLFPRKRPLHRNENDEASYRYSGLEPESTGWGKRTRWHSVTKD